MSKRTKFQSFEAVEIHRSEMKNAPYNPRFIRPSAKKGLKGNLKKRGLMSTLVWNKRTGNLVSGHKRLEILDELEGTEDYTLTVAAVSLSEKEEKEQNIFFNSTTVQGEFDFDLILPLLDEVDPFEAGLDLADLNIIGYDVAASALITPEQQQQEDEINSFFKKEEKRKYSADEIKARKNGIQAQAAERMGEGERYVSIVFETYEDKAAYMRKLGFNPDDLFIQAGLFKKAIYGKAKG